MGDPFLVRVGFEPTMSNLPQRKGSTPMSNYTPDYVRVNGKTTTTVVPVGIEPTTY
jgi:hypothetical protein